MPVSRTPDGTNSIASTSGSPMISIDSAPRRPRDRRL